MRDLVGSKDPWEDATPPKDVPVDPTDPHPEELPLCRRDRAVPSWQSEGMCKWEEVRALGATWPPRATSKGLTCQKEFTALVRGAASSRKQGSGDGPARAQPAQGCAGSEAASVAVANVGHLPLHEAPCFLKVWDKVTP